MANAFNRVRVEINLSSLLGIGTYVEWFLDRAFSEPGPYVFYIERAREFNSKYEVVNVVENQPFGYDPRVLDDPSGFANYFYRIRMRTGKGNYYLSEPVWSGEWWDKKESLIANRILQKEILRLKKTAAGVKGYLLRKRYWGEPCTRCLDLGTGDSTDSRCPVCFGTKFIGGYYDPIEYWVGTSVTTADKRLSGNGPTILVMENCRSLSIPSIDENDIWMNAYTSQVYRAMPGVGSIVELRNIPVVLSVNLRLLPSTDIMYTYGIPNKIIAKDKKC